MGAPTKIKITGDSTIDLSPELLSRYHVDTVSLYINMGEESHRDGISVTPEDIYAYVERTGALPKTAAPSVEDYLQFFAELKKENDTIIHFNISSEFSSAHQNARIAAEEIGGVYPIDSRNLSTGTGLLVLEACEMAAEGREPQEIIDEIVRLIPKVEASFIINRLDYLYKGGRCSGLVALGANVLHLRPVILVRDGKMEVGKKFRGGYDDCVKKYIESKLGGRNDIRDKRIFLTHTKCSDATLSTARKAVEDLMQFGEILDTTAGCTITNHCGENTLGVLFIHK